MLERLNHLAVITRINDHGGLELADTIGRVLECQWGLSIAVALDVPDALQTRWFRHASVLLAASEESMDCALQHDGRWWLWCLYETFMSHEQLENTLERQLVLARFLEHSLLLSAPRKVSPFLAKGNK